MPHLFYTHRVEGKAAIFDEDEVQHLRVVRVKPGEVVEASDGRGRIYRVRIREVGRRSALGEVLETQIIQQRVFPHVIAFVGASKWQRMRLVVEKSVELGVRSLIVYAGDLSNPGVEKMKIERYNRAAIEAMKQSRNVWLPSIRVFSNLDEALDKTSFSTLLVAEMSGEEPLKVLSSALPQPIAVVVGPQEGFSQREKELLRSKGARFLKLSDNILRMETAFIVIVSLVLHSARR